MIGSWHSVVSKGQHVFDVFAFPQKWSRDQIIATSQLLSYSLGKPSPALFFHQSPTYSLPYTQKAAVWTKVPLTKLSVSFFPYLAKQVDFITGPWISYSHHGHVRYSVGTQSCNPHKAQSSYCGACMEKGFCFNVHLMSKHQLK